MGLSAKKGDLFIFNSLHRSRNDGMYDHFNHGLEQIFGDGGSWDKK